MGVKKIISETHNTVFGSGNLGKPSGARYRTYDRLKNFLIENSHTLWDTPELNKAMEEVYNFP